MNRQYLFVLEHRVMQDFYLFFSQNYMFSGSDFYTSFPTKIFWRNRFNCWFISNSQEYFLITVNVDSQLMESPTQLNCILCCLFINLSFLIIQDLTIALSKTILKVMEDIPSKVWKKTAQQESVMTDEH